MLIAIRSGFEESIRQALPEFKRFNAYIVRISESDLPCVNIFFHKDRQIKKGGDIEERQVLFEIELGFKAGPDPERELEEIRKKLEFSIEANSNLQGKVLQMAIAQVDFLHDMVGESRLAILMMTMRVDYERPHPDSSPEVINPNLRPTVNGEPIDGQ